MPRPAPRLRSNPGDLAPPAAVELRTCLGCGGKNSKRGMYRFVAAAGALVVDKAQRLPGRGVYCCRRSGCLRKFSGRQRQINRGLRCEVTDWQPLFVLLEESLEQPGEDGSGC